MVELTPVKKTNGTMLRRWDPFDVFESIQQDMQRFWPRLFTVPAGTLQAPRMDVFEKDDTLVVKAELPGLKKEDVQVELEDKYLVIKGEVKAEKEVKEEAYYRMERSFGSFYRRVPVAFDVTPDKITATLTDGVLEVHIPKPVTTTPPATKIPLT